MPVKILQNDAEKIFLEEIAIGNQKGSHHEVLLCRFSGAGIVTTPDNILKLLKNVLPDGTSIYACNDGDMIISWKADQKGVSEKIREVLISYFSKELSKLDKNKIISFYDTKSQYAELEAIFQNKLMSKKEKPYVVTNKAGIKINIGTYFTANHKAVLKRSLLIRKTRKEDIVLVVEDQDFSANLLMGLLRKYYKCYHAKNAKEAINMYCEYAPNITFLDIELPDINGHYLSALFNKYDPENFISMVTANNFIKDVEIAKKNNVQGFVVKPFSKEKILSVVKLYSNKKV